MSRDYMPRGLARVNADRRSTGRELAPAAYLYLAVLALCVVAVIATMQQVQLRELRAIQARHEAYGYFPPVK